MLKFIKGYQNAESFIYNGKDYYVTEDAFLYDYISQIDDEIFIITKHAIGGNVVGKKKCGQKRIESSKKLAMKCFLLVEGYLVENFTQIYVEEFDLNLTIKNKIIHVDILHEHGYKWLNPYYELFLLVAYWLKGNLVQDLGHRKVWISTKLLL